MAYSNEHNPTLADSTPLYNDSILKFWNWFNDVWSCSEWVTWHKSNVAKYNLATANNKFMEHWDNLAMASSAIDCRSFDSAFRTYMKKVGLFESLFSGVGVISKPIGGTIDLASNLGSSVVNTSKGIENVSKILKVLLPIAVIFIALYFILKYNKQLKGK